MTWGVEECNGLALPLHLVGTDVLSDTTGFAGNHVGVTNSVQERSLTVVDVTHDRNDR